MLFISPSLIFWPSPATKDIMKAILYWSCSTFGNFCSADTVRFYSSSWLLLFVGTKKFPNILSIGRKKIYFKNLCKSYYMALWSFRVACCTNKSIKAASKWISGPTSCKRLICCIPLFWHSVSLLKAIHSKTIDYVTIKITINISF